MAVEFIVAGCDSSKKEEPEEIKIPIRISSTMTKVSESQFEKGDAIGLYVVNGKSNGTGSWNPGVLNASGNYLTNVKYTYDGAWSAARQYYWADEETPAEFFCYFPYIANITNVATVPISVPADQSTKTKFCSGEILWGETELIKPTENIVNINTNHRTAQLSITFAPGKGFNDESLKTSLSEVKVANLKCSGVLDLNDGTLSATGDASDIIPYFDGTTYRAMVIPQSIESKALVTFKIDGEEKELVQSINFTSNSRKKCTITLNRVSEGINVGIDDWEEDDTDYGGILN